MQKSASRLSQYCLHASRWISLHTRRWQSTLATISCHGTTWTLLGRKVGTGSHFATLVKGALALVTRKAAKRLLNSFAEMLIDLYVKIFINYFSRHNANKKVSKEKTSYEWTIKPIVSDNRYSDGLKSSKVTRAVVVSGTVRSHSVVDATRLGQCNLADKSPTKFPIQEDGRTDVFFCDSVMTKKSLS